jgi:hypothetical protein
MGVMRFLVHSPERITDEVAQRIYMAGLDRVPWYCRVHRTGDGFALERMVSDSGNLHVPWMVPGFGEVTLGTGSLMERDRPYHLEVELARGKVNQVRGQLAEWQTIGLTPAKPLVDKIHEAVELFALAATSQHEPAGGAAHAERAIEAAMQAAALLATTFTEQALAVRYRQAAKLSTQLGVNLGSLVLDESTAKLVRASFNTAAAAMSWRDIESSQGKQDWSITDAQITWCQNHHLQVYGGPLVRLDSLGLPDWLYLWEGDFDNILSFLSEHVEQTVTRYRGKVNLWLCASRINVGSALSLREVDKQRLAVRAIEITRKLDPRTPAVLCFDQPWAEYMSREDVDPPLYFADLLSRAGIGLAGIGLEMNFGYFPGGTYPRDMLDVSMLIDRWSLLGLPLYLLITVPSSDAPDPLARSSAHVLPATASGGCSQGSQNLWINRFLPMLLAKPVVQGIIWNQLLDSQPHEFPHGGLFDAAGSPKAALATLASQRRAYLI